MIAIVLKAGQNGYDAVDEHIREFWRNNNFTDTVVFRIGTSHDGVKYEIRNEIAYPGPSVFGDIEHLYDWWEGEKHIVLYWIRFLNEIKDVEREHASTVFTVSYFDDGDSEPTVTVFDNKEAAVGCELFFISAHQRVGLDECTLYHNFYNL